MPGNVGPTVYILKKARRNLLLFSAEAWRPSTYYEQAHSSFVPFTAAAVAVTTQYAAVANRTPPSSIIV